MLGIMFLLLVSLSCRYVSLHISAEGDINPIFKVGGIDNLYSFSVMEFDPLNREPSEEDTLWSFGKRYDNTRALTLWEISEIKYGTVPSARYEQNIPYDLKRPHPLEEGKWYKAEVFTVDKDVCQVRFQIKEGKVDQTNMVYINSNDER
jgi:hypothetical protein